MGEEHERIAGIARHGRLKRSNPVTGLLAGVAMVLAVLLVSGTALAALAVWQLTSEVSANSIDITGGDAAEEPVTIAGYKDGFNILIVGVDNDAAQGAAYGVRESALNDVNILVHVSADHSNAVVVSIPRDLIVAHPECTHAETGEQFDAMAAAPINEAMSRGGLPCVVDTVAAVTGLEIPFAGLVSFNGVVQMSDAVGGVPICLSAPINDPEAALNLPAGTSVVSGETALAFLRSRKGVGDGSDLSRISSQQIYLASLMRTVQGDGTFGNIPRLFTLANAATRNIQLSTSLASPQTMVEMALAIKDIDLDRLVFVQYPGTTDDPAFPGKVVPTQDLADAMFAKIAADEPFSLAAEPTEEPVTADPPADVPADPPADAGATDVPTQPATPSPEPLDGITGRTAADDSCAQAN
ncbi:LCP family protein [Cryobacterium sp. 1639]|uniref:LCP family protein n=1 Tax=Cryobacterium inferilacus TaxID=2866629 RepID=UPI001C72F86A|nr:LCP family protein [Cryobacterium sp. 1639]MBX0300518.1 LCP family protein [Cryobacterium sp. 1639]